MLLLLKQRRWLLLLLLLQGLHHQLWLARQGLSKCVRHRLLLWRLLDWGNQRLLQQDGLTGKRRRLLQRQLHNTAG